MAKRNAGTNAGNGVPSRQTAEAAAQSKREEDLISGSRSAVGVDTEQSSRPVEVLDPPRSVGGKRLILAIAAVLIVVFVGNVYAAKTNQRLLRQRNGDAIVFNDTKRVTQLWKRNADGMVLTAKAIDETAANSVRRYLKHQRAEYLRGDYSDSKFGNDDIPGRADLEFGTMHGSLNCRYAETDDGGTLTWIALKGDLADSQKEIMLDSLTQWGTNVATSPVVGP